ncbi:MAG: class II aldolase/adducin family protein [Alphaproteobacteria bacterium]|nr:class II aldolase/adducin family protein [Alphaproteobacteria bacterium]
MIAACRDMNRLGINQGTSGNISVRVDGGFLVTPTGVPYDKLAPELMVLMTADGRFKGDVLPSSEWRFHRDILARRPDANAVVHCHAMFSTTLAILHKEIPPIHYMIAAAGGPSIRCAPYATYGTQELSDHALAALEDRKACLLANHGMIALGPTLARAMWLAVEVETLAAQYWRALQAGKPKLLSAAEIATVMGKFGSYGQQPKLKPGPKRRR